MSDQKKNKKTKIGTVVSNKMDKSIIVLTERKVRHKLYGKYIRLNAKYMAHDPDELCNLGDKVIIEECRPLSKSKRWRLKSVVEKAVQI